MNELGSVGIFERTRGKTRGSGRTAGAEPIVEPKSRADLRPRFEAHLSPKYLPPGESGPASHKQARRPVLQPIPLPPPPSAPIQHSIPGYSHPRCTILPAMPQQLALPHVPTPPSDASSPIHRLHAHAGHHEHRHSPPTSSSTCPLAPSCSSTALPAVPPSWWCLPYSHPQCTRSTLGPHPGFVPLHAALHSVMPHPPAVCIAGAAEDGSTWFTGMLVHWL
ncbi:hypothetical protein BD779DRAFT_1467833 [Infundibulicybe gibba]|nr:hypothetical protein BD779DRAFT_1467833 [Infundibulicybe gibba]